MRVLILALAAAPALSASTVFFYDDFDDGTADGWHEISIVEYDVVDGMYRMYGGYEENHGISFNGDSAGYMSIPDYSARSLVLPETGTFFGMMVRFREDAPYNLMLVLGEPHQSLRLYRWHWVSIELLDSEPFDVHTGEEYWMRFETCGQDYRGRVWTGGPENEPDWWMVSAVDTLSSPGSVALFCAGLADVSLDCRFDDVEVTDVSQVFSPATWASVKTSFHQLFP